jgi:hypothetical protein
MYDLLTTTALVILLAPGVVLTLPPSGGLAAVIVHAVVFYVVQAFVSPYVPTWAIWVALVAVVGLKVFLSRSASTPSY